MEMKSKKDEIGADLLRISSEKIIYSAKYGIGEEDMRFDQRISGGGTSGD